MAERAQGPFREKSLERLSSPERLDQLLRVTDDKSWLPLAALAVLILTLFAWSVIGKIPVNVQGKGILMGPRGVVEFQSPGPGYLVQLKVQVDDKVERGDVLALIDRPDLDKQIELQKQKATELAAQIRTAPLRLQDVRAEGAGSANGGVESQAEASRALAAALKDKGLQSIEDERVRLDQQLRLARELAESRRKSLEGQQQLYSSGDISKEALIGAESAHLDSQARLSELQADLRELRTKALEVEEQYASRLERISDREQQLADVHREIDRLDHLLKKQGRIVSEYRGQILEISAVQGEFLAPGDRIGSMVLSEPDRPMQSVSYFTVRDGKRLEEGDTIHITPDTVERERYGSILGTVTSVSDFPVTLAEAESVIGNREVAEALIAGGYRIQVYSDLLRDDQTGGFDWSYSKGPDMAVSPGTTTTARVTVEHRTPITFVLPILRSSVGID